MRNHRRSKLRSAREGQGEVKWVLMAALAVGVVCAPVAQAATAGQITHLSGTLSAKRADGTSKLLSVKSEVMEGDTLGTESETYARVKFADGGEVVMRPGTQLKIENYSYNAAKPESDSIVLSMFKGGLGRNGADRQTQPGESELPDRDRNHRHPRHPLWRAAMPERLRRSTDHGRESAAQRLAR